MSPQNCYVKILTARTAESALICRKGLSKSYLYRGNLIKLRPWGGAYSDVIGVLIRKDEDPDSQTEDDVKTKREWLTHEPNSCNSMFEILKK